MHVGRTEMFFDDSLKGLKKELKAAGADMTFVKNWQKSYDKVKKQSTVMESKYIKAKADLEAVMGCLKDMEQLLISAKETVGFGEVKKKLLVFAKDMKKYKSSFVYEFLIGKEDKEFHLIYDTILALISSLCQKEQAEISELLILQSEVENLMAMTKEALEKAWPDFRAMAYFYLEHTDEELLQLPHPDKIKLIKKKYQDEFFCPMKQVLEAALGTERASKVMEVELWI